VVVTNKGKGLVEILDADGDGRLSVRELRGAHKVLGRLDADKDGQLAAAEVPKQHSGAFELGPAGGNAGLARVVFLANDMGRQTPLPARTKGPVWFRKMDRNRDGDVSRLEFLGTEEQFKAIDADGDGLITADEAERYDKRAKQSRE
jgi:Ca2+-binding EF-hand superfamily protein